MIGHDTQQDKYVTFKSGDEYFGLKIEYVNEIIVFQEITEIPESEDYMTIGGFILHEYENFPKLNEVVRIGRFEFKIIKNTMTKIELVRLKVID